MLNWKLFNARDIAFIVAVNVILHTAAIPLYRRIANRDTDNN